MLGEKQTAVCCGVQREQAPVSGSALLHYFAKMFLIPAVTGQAPGKKQSSNKRKSPEELKESDREHEKKRERKFQPA